LFRKKRRRKRPLEDAHSYLSGLAVLVYVVAEDVAVAVDFEEGEEDEEKREEEEEARTFAERLLFFSLLSSFFFSLSLSL